MPFERKIGPAQSVSLTGQIPQPPPKIPPEMVRRFPDWEKYETQMEEWWGHFTDLLQRDRGQIQTQFQTDETLAKDNLASIQASLTALSNQLAALNTPSLSPQVASLTAQVAAIVAQLAMHILATVAHGTTGNIVGTSDRQNLDSKTIGSTVPGYGRFVAGAIGYNQISASVTVTVTVNDFLIMAGPVNVFGSLVVDGTLVAM